ncbi:ribosomal RNA small subunit methyltransferase H [Striga asiatica]|uniref:Ribosomal RNA small subunit methyltransferase H n=1 Tax=Striga asiatica TaxID=4170 RepID=A0A5A7Q8X6_STRAF|nr:ribosomal RNA small subunit methyltransferase H [Striga asiatica]
MTMLFLKKGEPNNHKNLDTLQQSPNALRRNPNNVCEFSNNVECENLLNMYPQSNFLPYGKGGKLSSPNVPSRHTSGVTYQLGFSSGVSRDAWRGLFQYSAVLLLSSQISASTCPETSQTSQRTWGAILLRLKIPMRKLATQVSSRRQRRLNRLE